jgi:hypothetical protein
VCQTILTVFAVSVNMRVCGAGQGEDKCRIMIMVFLLTGRFLMLAQNDGTTLHSGRPIHVM